MLCFVVFRPPHGLCFKLDVWKKLDSGLLQQLFAAAKQEENAVLWQWKMH